MAGEKRRRKKLSISLPLFTPTPDPTPPKSPFRNNEIVGLGLVAAISNNPTNKSSILAISPRTVTSPIPILSPGPSGPMKRTIVPPIEEMEMCEEYTRVTAREGENLVRKREYFDDQSLGFLHACSLCEKRLQGLDIFIYRGEKAFCSSECRCKQISIDEHKEKCGSRAVRSPECSASPCSDSMQFSAGVAVA